MKRFKEPVKYHGISIPVPLVEMVKDNIRDKPEYRSVSSFVQEAIREKMDSTITKIYIMKEEQ